jgi:hypothetical protein
MDNRTFCATFGRKRKRLNFLELLRKSKKSFFLKETLKFSKYLTIWNFNIPKCFENMSHQTIIRLTPLCDKYLFFLKQ